MQVNGVNTPSIGFGNTQPVRQKEVSASESSVAQNYTPGLDQWVKSTGSSTSDIYTDNSVARGHYTQPTTKSESLSSEEFGKLLELMLENARNGDRLTKTKEERNLSADVEQFKQNAESEEGEGGDAGSVAPVFTVHPGFDSENFNAEQYLEELKRLELEALTEEDLEKLTEEERQEQKDEQLKERTMDLEPAEFVTNTYVSEADGFNTFMEESELAV